MNKTNKTVHLHNDTTFIFALFVIYLQLIRFNVSTAVSVILPPGLSDKNNVFRKHHIIFNHFDSKIIKTKSLHTHKNSSKTKHCVNVDSVKDLIKDGYLKVLQRALRFPCTKLCSIHNVWLSENSFNTQNSLNIAPLKTF